MTVDVDIISVADGPRMSLPIALNLLISQKVCPEISFKRAYPVNTDTHYM